MTSESYSERPSVEDARALQHFLRKETLHVAWFDEEGFVMAHTDEERAAVSRYPLSDCELHRSLSEVTEMPVREPGWYIFMPRSKRWSGPLRRREEYPED